MNHSTRRFSISAFLTIRLRKRMAQLLVRFGTIGLLVLALSDCGQRGDLVLPETIESEQQDSDTAQ